MKISLPKHAQGHPTFTSRFFTIEYWGGIAFMHLAGLFIMLVFILFGCVFPIILAVQFLQGRC